MWIGALIAFASGCAQNGAQEMWAAALEHTDELMAELAFIESDVRRTFGPVARFESPRFQLPSLTCLVI